MSDELLTGDGLLPGGVILGLLALISLVSLALILVKVVDLAGTLSGRAARLRALDRYPEPSFDLAHTPADRVLQYALGALASGMSRAAIEHELQRRGNAELAALGRYVRVLELIAVICPLLGLLGTVLGMIVAFQALEMAGGAANASVLAGGIWQALLTTAAGLIVAIPAAAAAALCNARVDRVAGQMEDIIARLLAMADAHRGLP